MTDERPWRNISDKKPTRYVEVEIKTLNENTWIGQWTGEVWLDSLGDVLGRPDQAPLWRYKAFKQ